jgi:aminopeptidase N
MCKFPLTALIFILAPGLQAMAATPDQVPGDTTRFTHADTLRGSLTPERAWWDVTWYDLHVTIDPSDSTISGYNTIAYTVVGRPRAMQIDLMTPLVIDSIIQDGRPLAYRRDGNAFFVHTRKAQPLGSRQSVSVYYHGAPRVARRPPWDGGFIWTTDSLGNPWIATACQGVGASIWWPNKDYQGDEPDSQRISVTVPQGLIDISNGRLEGTTDHPDGTTTYRWKVDDPINNYDVALNVGKYVHFGSVYQGEKGPLSLDYWVMPYHLPEARRQFTQVNSMLRCFEYWFGPYPWYRDGYKLVEAPQLGMEHQSCIAYGNHYENGYLGSDLSGTGWGLKWDFIIIHESAHEWFGNNITATDIADMWVHEAFANYAESLYTECEYGRKAGEAYCRGNRKNVLNDKPVTGHYGVNDEGSGDMYYKGGNMLATIREILDDDAKWRGILRGLNSRFWHQTVTGRQVEDYISEKAGMDLGKVFAQYLTTTRIPVFDYYIRKDTLHYRWSGVIPGFDMPLDVTLSPGTVSRIHPTEAWQAAPAGVSEKQFRIDENYYVTPRKTRP